MATPSEMLALFVDVDNFCISVQEAGLPFHFGYVMQRLRQEGRIMSARAYAHWPQWQRFMREFQENAFEFCELPTSASGKNTADIQLALDALEMVLSPRVQPEIIAIASGDRDFVPLVQKLKRYGVRVIGLGVEGTASNNLQHSCDMFLFYDNLLPEDTVEDVVPVTPQENLEPAYRLMRSAIDSLEQKGRVASGSNVRQMMQQLDPTFDLARYKVTFKEIAFRAHKAGFISFSEDSNDLQLGPSGNGRAITSPRTREREQRGDRYAFGTVEEALQSYQAILQEKRIPLLEWKTRERLVDHLWGVLMDESNGMTIQGMVRELQEYAEDEDLRLPTTAIYKLIYTLNFAHCFGNVENEQRWVQVDPSNFHYTCVTARGDAPSALRDMNTNYMKNILLAHPEARLISEAVARLLFESPTPEQTEEAEVIVRELQPPTAMSAAFEEAKERRSS